MDKTEVCEQDAHLAIVAQVAGQRDEQIVGLAMAALLHQQLHHVGGGARVARIVERGLRGKRCGSLEAALLGGLDRRELQRINGARHVLVDKAAQIRLGLGTVQRIHDPSACDTS